MLSVYEISGDSEETHDLAVHKKVASFGGRWPNPIRSLSSLSTHSAGASVPRIPSIQ